MDILAPQGERSRMVFFASIARETDDVALQWIVIDSKVYDLSKFANMHPGGLSVLLAEGIGVSPYHHPVFLLSHLLQCSW
jgi:hypothetical protein